MLCIDQSAETTRIRSKAVSLTEINLENQIGNRDEDLINPRPKGDESHIETGFRQKPVDRNSSLVDRRGDFVGLPPWISIHKLSCLAVGPVLSRNKAKASRPDLAIAFSPFASAGS